MEDELRARLLAATALVALVPAERIAWSRRRGMPAVALWRVSGRPDYHLKGASGLVDSVVQIDCWGSTYEQAKNIARAVKVALSGFSDAVFRGVFIENERDGFEAGDGAPSSGAPSNFFRTSLDVRVWSTVS
ncbi:DUF3168 domain-containing protein [Phenylobacterium sp. J426]|uniref:DUF3168 domain-containing protein n=1 Tax=Phenylobacterium sp. J426 TaxID=2898439 RepID=UPI0021512E96|nr:DUF3168 domain-containing protein [Phenylobacterium sp. J426]MCR5874365.1 DUF3168 domain-containing protein [Phenylobacterium sp. J426]